MILAWTRDKLSRGQASAYRTHRQTDAANDNTRRPKLASGKNREINGTEEIALVTPTPELEAIRVAFTISNNEIAQKVKNMSSAQNNSAVKG